MTDETTLRIGHVMRRFVVDKWGGTETVVFNLCRAFRSMGHTSEIFCTRMFSEVGTEELDGVPIHRFDYVFPWLFLSNEAQGKLRLKGGSPLSLPLYRELRRRRDLSIIHTHIQHRMGGAARTVARALKIPYVVSVHGGFYTLPEAQIERMRDPFKGKPEWGKVFGWLWGSRKVLQDASAILCVGRDEFADMQARYPTKRVYYVPNGVDVERFQNAKPDDFLIAHQIPRDQRIVLCVSRIDFQKNQLMLVRAFERFAETHPEHHLYLIGPVTVDAYMREIERALAGSRVRGRVHIIPGLTPDSPLLPSAYKAAEMFVLPTDHEPFGIVILEAWAAGLPVIATRVGGIPGFTHEGSDVLLVNRGDQEALTGAMAELADAPELRERLVVAGLEEVRSRYDWASVAEQVMGIYRTAIEEFGR
ncbi:MAG: glycosyltransferase family 4 protein [Verrucomicrobiota bacterium]|jgi:glycosyltransferase involved in cell wall biosynthesis|nr:glycosyltransferase family 4 protein [Verrucomicrobiota bacterium]MDD8045816.1 glycosyltransferase family 4 protein [Verrucomicrobiota bacterium]MDD8049994.1 glycosyltransferase family 4 protein [Verrucomicrobiota bacterium]